MDNLNNMETLTSSFSKINVNHEYLSNLDADINLSLYNAIIYSNNSILPDLLKYEISYITLENALHIAYNNNNTVAIDLLINHIEK